MALENKLGITDSAELAREEEKITYRREFLLRTKDNTLNSTKS